jgi:hypothetical protein
MRIKLYGENAVHSEIADSLSGLTFSYSRLGDNHETL